MYKNKVCHITVTHSPTDNRIFHNQCNLLKKNGYNVSYIVPNVKSKISDGIKIIGVKCSMKPLLRLLISSQRVYRRAINENADIYHFHDIELFYVGLKLKKKGKKVIFDSHEDWLHYANDISWLPLIFRKLIIILIRFLYKNFLNKFDAVISVTPHIVDNLKKYTDKVYMITNYPKLQIDEDLIITKEDYFRRGNSLFYSGTVSNQEVILEAISYIVDVRYNIAGNLIESYKDKICKHSAWTKVNYYGLLSKKDLGILFKKQSIAITLLHYHANVGNRLGTLGNTKLFEYLKYGLPIICTDFEIWKERLIEKYNCGICVNPYDPLQVKEAIEFLILNKEIAYQMGQNSLKAFKEEFNWNSQEETFMDIYRSLN